MAKPITEIDDPRLVKALAHPLRIRVLGVLERRSATPKELAKLVDAPLENIAYHVRTLRDFGFIELEEERMVRGAVEHQYRLAERPRLSMHAWEQLPSVVREALEQAKLAKVWESVGRAATQGKMDRPESHVARQYATLDQAGYDAAAAAVEELLERLAVIERESAARLGEPGAEPVPAMLVAMLFDAPDP